MNLPHSQATNNEASPEKRHNDNSTKLYNFKEMVIGTYIYSATISLSVREIRRKVGRIYLDGRRKSRTSSWTWHCSGGTFSASAWTASWRTATEASTSAELPELANYKALRGDSLYGNSSAAVASSRTAAPKLLLLLPAQHLMSNNCTQTAWPRLTFDLLLCFTLFLLFEFTFASFPLYLLRARGVGTTPINSRDLHCKTAHTSTSGNKRWDPIRGFRVHPLTEKKNRSFSSFLPSSSCCSIWPISKVIFFSSPRSRGGQTFYASSSSLAAFSRPPLPPFPPRGGINRSRMHLLYAIWIRIFPPTRRRTGSLELHFFFSKTRNANFHAQNRFEGIFGTRE